VLGKVSDEGAPYGDAGFTFFDDEEFASGFGLLADVATRWKDRNLRSLSNLPQLSLRKP